MNLIIGYNDAEEYILPFLKDIKIDYSLLKSRQLEYANSFKKRATGTFGENCTIWSLSDSGITVDKVDPIIASGSLEKEIKFFNWLFSESGPYKGKLSFSTDTLKSMTMLKYKLYGNQGKFLSYIGGILLQTEGPGVWLERTQMLRCTGSNAIPAIYPWIRKEELSSYTK